MTACNVSCVRGPVYVLLKVSGAINEWENICTYFFAPAYHHVMANMATTPATTIA